MSKKKCTKCGEIKPVEAFPRDLRVKCGRTAQCRACHAARFKKHYEANKPKILTRNAAWRESNPERVKELARRHYARRVKEQFGD